MYFKNNCGHVFVDGSKVIVETDTFKRIHLNEQQNFIRFSIHLFKWNLTTVL